MDVIYIVEESQEYSKLEEPYKPNFTMPGKEGHIDNVSKTKNSTYEAAADAARLGLLFAVPTPLLFAAAVSSPLVYNFFRKDNKSLKDGVEDAEKEEIARFLNKHSFTPKETVKLGYSFPPGHPKVGQAYIQHPLSTLAGEKKKNIYIPYEKYDSLLFEEREAELIKLLVTLGATKISTTKKRSSKLKSSLGVSGSVDAAMVECKVSGSGIIDDNESHIEVREYILDGYDLKKGQSIDRSLFAWIDFEPSWETLVFAREVGGCTKAELDVNENTSFSTDKNIVLSLKYNACGGGVSGNSFQLDNSDQAIVVKAEFKPLV